MKKALKPSIRVADDAALLLANAVIESLKNNTYFPSPTPGLVELQSAIDNYTASLARAKYGSRMDIAEKKADKHTLINMLGDECDYVNITAKGNLLMLSTCGFRISKDRAPKVLGTAIAKVERRENGGVILSTGAVNGAISYRHQYTTDPSAALWSEIVSTRATCKIDDLVPGTVYYFRIVAIGTKNQVTVSNVVNKMAA